MRQVDHRGLHRTPHQQTQRSRTSVVLRVLPILLAAAGLAVFSLFNLSTAAQRAAPAAAAVPNPNCSLVVPANPLTAAGLATPYQLVATDAAGGPCNEANANQSAFVEATVIDPATGAPSVYRPLVVDKGTTPAAAPVLPTLPANAVVGIWFGFNGTTLTLQDNGGSLNQGNCVNGSNGSQFGQFAYCNGPALFTAANTAIGAGKLAVPALGTAKDGQPCPTTRDFGLVDQDQSDNVITTYLLLANGKVAQNNAANTAALAGSNPIVNGSDNLLLNAFVDPALGCTPFTAPDLTNNGQPVGSLALDELMAAADQRAPIALVPTSDPMTLQNNNASTTKTNLYRVGVNQPPVNQATDTPTAYCQNLVTIGQQRTQLDKNLTLNGASPSAAMATNLFTFLANRLSQSFTNLGCMNLLHMNNPVTVTLNGAGVATAATFAAAAGAPGTTGTPGTNCGPAQPTTTTGPTTTAPAPGNPTTTTGAAAPTSTGAPTATGAGTPPGNGAPTATSTGNAGATTTAAMAPATTTTSTCAPTPTTTGTQTAGNPDPNGWNSGNSDANAAHRARHRPSKY
ncbi:MAG TPA: hypothetical protein VGL06_00425 [Pseudonocardiaceae bacterium]